ncbi:TetR/AcrR family transcriptional regulator [Micromonosporaceae bacterium Da 78-11]
MRADAQENHDRLLDAAGRAFARDGADASLKAIALDAGVGIGTLYRRFPSRDRLIEATYHHETARLCAAAPALLDTTDPVSALRGWMDRFVDYLGVKHGIGAALPAILASDGDQRMRTRDLLTEAVATLIRAGVEQDRIRADVDPYDVLMGLGGVALIAGRQDQRALAGRLLDLLLDGVTSRVDAR